MRQRLRVVAPGEAATMMTKATMSGTFDTAVMRCSHQCSTPCPAAPRPFTRASGVRMETRCRSVVTMAPSSADKTATTQIEDASARPSRQA